MCNNIIELAGNPYTVATATELHPDTSYVPRIITPIWIHIYNWFSGIPIEYKVFIFFLLILASIVLAVATHGASLGAQAELLGSITAASALSAAATTALVDLSIGIGFAVAGWVINSAVTGNWDTNALQNDIADAIFFTGVFMFIAASVNTFRYIYRSAPYPTPERYKLANRGHSKGALEPENLKHQLSLEQSASTPLSGIKVPMAKSMKDNRWPMEEGWIKMQQEFLFYKKKRK